MSQECPHKGNSHPKTTTSRAGTWAATVNPGTAQEISKTPGENPNTPTIPHKDTLETTPTITEKIDNITTQRNAQEETTLELNTNPLTPQRITDDHTVQDKQDNATTEEYQRERRGWTQ
jgi:hypothetical protein